MSAFRASLAARAAFRASPRASLRATPSAGFLKPAFQPHFGNTLYVFFFLADLSIAQYAFKYVSRSLDE